MNQSPTSKRERLILAGFCLVAVVIRLGAVEFWTGLQSPPESGRDEYEYDVIAWNLVRGDGYQGVSPDVRDKDGALRQHPTAYRPPVTPFFYAAVYALAGHNYAAAHVANSLIAGTTIVLVFFIARRVFGQAAGWLAAGLYIFYPQGIYYELTLLSEVHGAFLVCLFVWLAMRIKDDKGPRWAIGAGAALGALLLCKPGFVFLVLLLPIWVWAIGDWAHYRRAALIPIVAAVIVSPWIVRNFVEFEKFIPFSTSGGSLLLQANNRIVATDPKCHGYAVWDTSLPEYAPLLRATNDEFARDALAKRLATAWLSDNVDQWFYLIRGKFWRLWTPTYFGARHQELASIVYIYYGTILAAFAVSVVPTALWLYRTREPALILVFPILATVMMAIVFHGQHRYRFPIDSLCIVTAAGGITWLVRSIAEGSFPKLPPTRLAARRIVPWLSVIASLIVVLLMARAADERRVAAIRTDLRDKQFRLINSAVAAYCTNIGRPPYRLADLIPEYLPNAECLHAPTHSLEYHDYLLLGSEDAEAADRICSYTIERQGLSGKDFRVVQIHGL